MSDLTYKLLARHARKVFPSSSGQIIAIEDMSLHVRPHEFVSIVGTSGCGKSTFLNMVAGLTDLTSGELLVDDHPIDGPGLDRGMVFQAYTLFPWLNVQRNVEFALKKRPLSAADRAATALRFLKLVGLDTFARSYPVQLSGGMQQRVAIARALAYDPSILLMDEPFGALDAQTRELMQELLLQIWETSGTTILFITHDIDEAIFLSDRVYVMTARPGRIKAEVAVTLPRPRSYEMLTEPVFVDIKRRILSLIREESLRSIALTEHVESLT